MRKLTLLFCALFFYALYSTAMVAEDYASTPSTKAAIVNKALARECLAQSRKGDEAAEPFMRLRLGGLDQRDIERLTGFVRDELGKKAVADAAAVPPRGNLDAAWLLNRLGAASESLVYDLAIDGDFTQRVGSGKRYRFLVFGKEELVVHMDAATVGYESNKQNMKAASRLYLRKMPGGKEYYVAVWIWLVKHHNSPPPPNPEGRRVPGLLNTRLLVPGAESPQ